MHQDQSEFELDPENQFVLYKAIRDGDIVSLKNVLNFQNDMSKDNIERRVNCRPFSALWHEPGPECTLLHLAVCCVQVEVVKFLIDHGADPYSLASDLTPLQVIDKYDLFLPARMEKAKELQDIKQILMGYSKRLVE